MYADVAEFYWPFFDKSNEATYGNFTVRVFPPEPTTALIAFGYDEAFKTEAVLENGQVEFAMGEVSRKRNGDIRVAYTRELFPASNLTANKVMYDEIVAAKQHLLDSEMTKAARKEQLSLIGSILVPAFALERGKRNLQNAIKRAKEKGEEYFTPHRLQKMQNAWNASS